MAKNQKICHESQEANGFEGGAGDKADTSVAVKSDLKQTDASNGSDTMSGQKKTSERPIENSEVSMQVENEDKNNSGIDDGSKNTTLTNAQDEDEVMQGANQVKMEPQPLKAAENNNDASIIDKAKKLLKRDQAPDKELKMKVPVKRAKAMEPEATKQMIQTSNAINEATKIINTGIIAGSSTITAFNKDDKAAAPSISTSVSSSQNVSALNANIAQPIPSPIVQCNTTFVIVEEGSPRSPIVVAKQQLLQDAFSIALKQQLLKMKTTDEPIQIEYARFKKGFFVVKLNNNRGFSMLSNMVANALKPWTGARLCLKPKPTINYYPFEFKLDGFLADEPTSYILHMIAVQNVGLNTSSWLVGGRAHHLNMASIYVNIDEKSFRKLVLTGNRIFLHSGIVLMTPVEKTLATKFNKP